MNTLSFPQLEEVEEQAAAWIAAVDRGLSSTEQAALETWVAESPLHGETLVKCASMWDLLDVLQPIAKLLPLDESHNTVRSTHEHADYPQTALNKTAGNSAATPRKFALAASVIICLGAAILFSESLFVSGEKFVSTELAAPPIHSVASDTKAPTTVLHSYTTAVGEISNVVLADGSLLQLNTDSEALVQFSATQRTVILNRGEVFFEVAKNPNKPFVVQVGDERVTAVGTAFSVDKSTPSNTEVIVTEGKVKVNRAKVGAATAYADLYLTPGQRAVISDNATNVSSDNDLDTTLAWRKGMLVFEGESLSQVIQEIDRYTPLRFKIIDQEIASIPVGGFFRTGDLEQLLLVLERNFGVESYRLGEEILLSKAVE